MENNAIEIRNLSSSYGTHEVLKEINTVFPAGKFSVLLGINGSGKSTLFKILSGLKTDFKGELKFFGKDKSEFKNKKEALLGFLPQNFNSIFPFSVKEIMLTGRASYSKFGTSKEDLELVKETANQLDIENLLEHSFNNLSGGQQQLALIGRILVQNPKIILLDEPTNHLDIPHQHQLLHRLQNLIQKGYTVVAIMHDPVLAHQYADYIYYLNDKKISGLKSSSEPDIELLQSVFKIKFDFIKNQNERFLVTKKISF